MAALGRMDPLAFGQKDGHVFVLMQHFLLIDIVLRTF